MNFVEKSRNVEPHSESILFLYLQDANGAPATNKKVKIFAGPPPTGEPPYFVDDDPNNPNRRTDGNGKFQFVVANGAPAQRLDFWVQVLATDGTPESKPFQFPFPAGEARWVIVSAAPEGSVQPDDDKPAPTPDLSIDPRLASQVNVSVKLAELAPNTKYWKLISAQYQDPEESGGNINIIVFVQDERGAAIPGQRVLQKFPGDQASGITDERGHIEFPMSGNSSFAPDRGESGPYSAVVDGLPSDEVVGMGLPLRRHVQFVLTYRRSVFSPEPTPAPVPTPPPATPEPPTTPQPPSTPPPATPQPPPQSQPPPQPQPQPQPPPVSSAPTKKVFKHYLLFGPGTQQGTMTNLILALDYIVHFAPVVGFSVDEALNAERVTIVGGTSAVSGQEEQRLRDGGSKVARLQAADSYALENLFQQLLASGSPFQS